MALRVELVSPERILYSGEAEMVICRTVDGEIAFLTGHAPFVGALGVGPVTIRSSAEGSDERAAVHGGFVEVSQNQVTVLSDVAEMAGEIDVERARSAKSRLEASGGDEEEAERNSARRRAEVRIEVATEAGGH